MHTNYPLIHFKEITILEGGYVMGGAGLENVWENEKMPNHSIKTTNLIIML